MAKVILAVLVDLKLKDLVEILYDNGYFGLKLNAQKYVDRIVNFVYDIPNQQHYPTIKSDYGAFYSKFKPNKNTAYYITFDIIEGYYFVQNVITNHTPDYPIYIKE